MSGKAAMCTLLCLKEECFFSFFSLIFFLSRASMWKAFLLGREGLQHNYWLEVFVSKWHGLQTVIAWLHLVLESVDIVSRRRCKSPFILSNWGACIKSLVCSVRGSRDTSRRQLRLPAFSDFYFFFSGGWGQFWVARDPDTLTKCLKVRWAECRQLLWYLFVAKAYCCGCEGCPSKLASMMGMSDYHWEIVLHSSCELLH